MAYLETLTLRNEVTQHEGCQDQGIRSDIPSGFPTDHSWLRLPQRHTCLLTQFRCCLSVPHSFCVGIDTSCEGLRGESLNSLPSHAWVTDPAPGTNSLKTKGHSQTMPSYPSKGAAVDKISGSTDSGQRLAPPQT